MRDTIIGVMPAPPKYNLVKLEHLGYCLAKCPRKLIIKGMEIEFSVLNTKSNQKIINIQSGDYSPVMDIITEWNGLNSVQEKEVIKLYKEHDSFEKFEKGLSFSKNKKEIIKSLYGFNYLLNETKKYEEFGMTFDMSEELFKKFGFNAFKVFKSTPYDCIGETLPFHVADNYYYYAHGISHTASRYDNWAEVIFRNVEQDGSTIVSAKNIGENLTRFGITKVDTERFSTSITKRVNARKNFGIVKNKKTLVPQVVIKDRFKEEQELASLILARKKESFVSSQKIEEFRKNLLKEGITLSEGQSNALNATLFKGVTTCITGGPGTGKTTVLKQIIRIMRDSISNLIIKTAAPTGKAAKRMSEATGEDCTTIHKLLEPRATKGESGFFFSFAKNEMNKINADVVVIDESSMIDTRLAIALYKALKPETLLLLLGDVNQLPSVGAGQVFRDMIISGKIPVYRLTKTLRQSKGSILLRNIHAFRDRRVYFEEGNDFHIVREDTPNKALRATLKFAVEEYKKRGLFGFQVLVPQHNAVVGTENLNKRLQMCLNNNFEESSNEKFFVGDKVIFLQNNYAKGFLNGDTGSVVKTTKEGVTINVIGSGEVFVPREEYDKVDLAYAITVHKSQGSEYPSVCIPMLKESRILLSQNWVYTAISRAKELCTIIAEDGVFDIVGGESLRETTLASLL